MNRKINLYESTKAMKHYDSELVPFNCFRTETLKKIIQPYV